MNTTPKMHKDGSVTYWSVYDQQWLTTWRIPDHELAAMDTATRERVLRHMRKHSAAAMGSARTPRKATAARENGRKGGRPRKQ